MSMRSALLSILIGTFVVATAAEAAPRNQVLGTWRMVSAEIERNVRTEPAYERRPNGMLIFAADMHGSVASAGQGHAEGIGGASSSATLPCVRSGR